ncbi:MAG TPA: hypothetical protein VM925_13105 [Labilithrix sp.]|nr:hypothetical protein [Labilithrix sp.]
MLSRNPSARIVLVEGSPSKAELMGRALGRLGFSNVVACPVPPRGLPQIDEDARIVFIDVESLGVARALEVTRSIRSRDDYVYIVALTRSVDDPIASALDDDVDDFIVETPAATDLRLRLREAERVIRLETEVRSKANALETALRRLEVAAAQRALSRSRIRTARARQPSVPDDSDPPIVALRRSRTWREIDAVLGAALENFLQLSFETPEALEDAPAFAAEIALIEPVRQLELVCGVTASDRSLLDLSKHLMNEPDLEAGQSLLLEVANVLMGALRTAFGELGFAFTGGIPNALEPARAHEGLEPTAQRRTVYFRTREGTSLGIWVDVQENRTAVIPATELREGMVLKEDLRDAAGNLLVRRGTRLSRTRAERLARAAPEAFVDVFVSTTKSQAAA